MKFLLFLILTSSNLFAEISQVSSGEPISATKINEVIQGHNQQVSQIEDRTKKEETRKIAFIKDVKAATASGGNSVAGWQVRTLNTLEDPDGVVSALSNNTFTLPPGNYLIEASAPAAWPSNSNVLTHKIILKNTSNNSNVLIGTTEGSCHWSITRSKLEGRFSIATEQSFQIHHWTLYAANNGLGSVWAGNSGVNEVYTIVKLTKLP